MAIDTADKRASALQYQSPAVNLLPSPDSSIVADDRRHVGKVYRPALSGSSYTLVLDQGSYSLAGQALLNSLSSPLSQGSYSLSGQTLLKTVSSPFSQGSYGLTGQGLLLSFPLTINQGSYSLAGQELTLTRSLILSPDQGSYGLTGYTLAFNTGSIFALDQGSFSLAGNDLVNSIATPSGGGSYTLAGQQLQASISSPLNQGAYSYTGYQASLNPIYVISPDSGSFSLTGNGLDISLLSQLDLGAYVLSGQDLEFRSNNINLSLSAGYYGLTGYDLGESTSILDVGAVILRNRADSRVLILNLVEKRLVSDDLQVKLNKKD